MLLDLYKVRYNYAIHTSCTVLFKQAINNDGSYAHTFEVSYLQHYQITQLNVCVVVEQETRDFNLCGLFTKNSEINWKYSQREMAPLAHITLGQINDIHLFKQVQAPLPSPVVEELGQLILTYTVCSTIHINLYEQGLPMITAMTIPAITPAGRSTNKQKCKLSTYVNLKCLGTYHRRQPRGMGTHPLKFTVGMAILLSPNTDG